MLALRRLALGTALAIAACLPGAASAQSIVGANGYLPLSVGLKWVLRHPSQATPVTFEVVAEEQGGHRVRSTTPWGVSEWTLVEGDGTYQMVAYGTGGPMQPLPNKPLYLDFTRPAGGKWSGQLGALSVVSRSATVRSAGRTYADCVQIRQGSGGNLLFTFAKGVGYVQFGEGSGAFVLDESASTLPTSAATGGIAAPPPASPATPSTAAGARSARGTRLAARDPMPFGITPNRFATEPLTADVMMTRFAQTLDAGAGFLVVNGEWAELEPQNGAYALDSLSQAISVAAGANIPISYTLRVINTIVRDVPSQFRNTRWSDPGLRARLLRLIETMAPSMRGRVRWFMLGYEIDGYFEKHPGERQDFIELHRAAKAKLQELIPGIQVSTTFTFYGLEQLKGPLASLDAQLDFLAVTYCPLEPDFTAKDPSVVPGDFRTMTMAAAGRKILFQEIGYPTAAAARGSEARQADFYRLALQELKRAPASFAAVNFMTLADLSDADAERFASFYGMKGQAAFTGVLKTLGLFDQQGRPKKSWEVLLSR